LVYDEFDIVDGEGRSLDKPRPEPTWTGYRIPLSRIPAQLRSLIVLGHPWTCVTSAMSVRRRLVIDLLVPEEPFRHSPDLFLGLVLPFMTDVAIVESPQTAYVYHGHNVGLFRTSAANRELHARQMDCIRRYVENGFSVTFLDYGGRSIYGPRPGKGHDAGRWSPYLDELRHIVRADVEAGIKRRCLAKLTASLVLPDVPYARLQGLRSRYRGWRSREYRRRIAMAGRKESVDG
jgi:hypothetical protein